MKLTSAMRNDFEAVSTPVIRTALSRCRNGAVAAATAGSYGAAASP